MLIAPWWAVKGHALHHTNALAADFVRAAGTAENLPTFFRLNTFATLFV
jgi:hypothetical protein